LPNCTAWLYGPIGAGALSVRMIFFSMHTKVIRFLHLQTIL
jgi:hypothetical protein